MTRVAGGAAAGSLEQHVDGWLVELCRHPDRDLGSPGNRAAVELVEDVARCHGFTVASEDFDCLGWEHGLVSLRAAGRQWDVHAGPYSPPCDVVAEIRAATTIEELEALDMTGRVVLVHGDLAREQLVPKSFPFFDSPDHRRILNALERGQPAALIAATGHGSGFAGSLYPFPLIDDGEFAIPSVYLTDADGAALLATGARDVELHLVARRFPTRARQVTLRRGSADVGRIVMFAHIDSKQGAPGAIDNAAGVATLLALTELLRDHDGPPLVELVPINGEDNYNVPGERLYLAANEGRWEEIALGVNVDGAGSRDAATAISFYGCPDALREKILAVAAGHPGIEEGDPWYEGDHGLFLFAGRPAIAFTSANARELCATVTHSERDRLELVDPARIAELARFLGDTVAALAADPQPVGR